MKKLSHRARTWTSCVFRAGVALARFDLAGAAVPERLAKGRDPTLPAFVRTIAAGRCWTCELEMRADARCSVHGPIPKDFLLLLEHAVYEFEDLLELALADERRPGP